MPMAVECAERTPAKADKKRTEDNVLTCLVPSSFGSLVLLPQNYTHLNVNRLLPATLPSAHYVHLHSYCLCVAMSLPLLPPFSTMWTMILARALFYPLSRALQASSLHSLLQPDLLHTNKIWSKWKTHYLTTSWRSLLAASPKNSNICELN